MLKNPASFVLASVRGSMYRSIKAHPWTKSLSWQIQGGWVK